jgi:hypothetical protein
MPARHAFRTLLFLVKIAAVFPSAKFHLLLNVAQAAGGG